MRGGYSHSSSSSKPGLRSSPSVRPKLSRSRHVLSASNIINESTVEEETSRSRRVLSTSSVFSESSTDELRNSSSSNAVADADAFFSLGDVRAEVNTDTEAAFESTVYSDSAVSEAVSEALIETVVTSPVEEHVMIKTAAAITEVVTFDTSDSKREVQFYHFYKVKM